MVAQLRSGTDYNCNFYLCRASCPPGLRRKLRPGGRFSRLGTEEFWLERERTGNLETDRSAFNRPTRKRGESYAPPKEVI